MQHIAHRGASAHMPENTLQAFDKAIELGADMIELDVRRCASGELVVYHDRTLFRLTGKQEFVAELSFEALSLIPMPGGTAIPTLEQTIAHVAGRARLMIEWKEVGLAEDTLSLIQAAVKTSHWQLQDFWCISFLHHELLAARQALPDLQTGATLSGYPVDAAEYAVRAQANAVIPDFRFLDAAFVGDAHARKLDVFTWTADLPEEIAFCKALGVDGIMSNYPDRLR